MKNKIKITGVIMIVALFAVTSCQKSDHEVPEAVNNNENYAKIINEKISNFRDQMHSTYKSGTLMTLDTAIWNLEALITYDEAFPDSSSRDFKIKQADFTLPVDQDNMVSEEDVQALYIQMLDTVDYQLDQFTEQVKFLAFSDVELVEIENGYAKILVTNGYGFNFILGIYYPFDEDDDWIWGTLGEEYGETPAGKCDGTEVGVSDGSNELQYRLNHPAALPANTTWTDLETLVATGPEFIDDDSFERIFWGWDYPNDECLTNDLLTYYLVEADDIIKTPEEDGGLKPPGKAFIRIYILDDLAMSSQGSWHMHRYFVTYGKPSPKIPD